MQTKFSRSYEFSHSKKQMNAPILPPIEKFPKHAVPNTTIQTENNFGGMTYSAEIQGDTAEGLAEVRKLIFVFNYFSPLLLSKFFLFYLNYSFFLIVLTFIKL